MKALQSENQLLESFKTELARASEFYLGMALVTKSGLKMVVSSIERCLEKRGYGQVLFGIDLPTDPDAIQMLCELETRYKKYFEVRRFQPGKRFFHPKVSVFIGRTGAKTAIVGSSNLTGGGLRENHETNIFLNHRRIVQTFLDYFEEQFQGAHARKIDKRWLDQYRQLWSERRKIEKRQRNLREKARHLGTTPSNTVNRIKGHVYAFTGSIAGWPRERILYPRVKRRGGYVAKNITSAECLVHAELLGGRKTTRKLVKARQMNIPIITEEQFLKLMGVNSRETR
jgi:HKD family nuclease